MFPFVKTIRRTKQKAYCASGADLQAITQYIKDSDLFVVTSHALQAKGFAVDIIEDIKAESDHRGKGFGDTTIEKSWMPQNGQNAYITGESLCNAYLRTIVADFKYTMGTHTSRGYKMVWSDIRQSQYSSFSMPGEEDPFWSLMHACFGRRFATTKGELIGLVPGIAQPGDQVYCLLGGQVLYVLRTVKNHFIFIGECYLHGMMDGEALGMLKDGSRQLQAVEIW